MSHDVHSPPSNCPEDPRIAGLPVNVLEMLSLVSAAGCLFLMPDLDIRFISGWLVATVVASRIARFWCALNRPAESASAPV